MSAHGHPHGLPATWTRVQLGEIGVVHCGQSPPTAAVNKEGRGTPYVTGPEQWDGSRLHMDKWTTEPKRMAPAGSVFVTVKGAGVGTVFPGVAAAIGRDVYAFEPKAGVSPSFVEHALRFTVQDVIRHAVGDIPGLSKSHITDHWIGLPPPEEQQLIVAAIESHFSRLDAATATLERVQRNLERYRASVLKAAVEGRLVPTEAELAKKEGRSYEPASILLKRIFAERRRRWEEAELTKLKAKGKPPTDDRWKARYEEPAAPDTDGLSDLPEGWCWAAAEQLAIGGRPIIYGIIKPGPDTPGGVPYVRVTEMKTGHIDVGSLRRCHPDRASLFSRATLASGDLLVSKDGTIGKVAVVPPELEGGSITQHVLRFSASPLLNRRYLVRAIESSHCQRWMAGETKGVALQGVNVEDFRRMPIPVPPLLEQDRIASHVDDQLSLSDAARSTAVANGTRVARLRQSILKWAFEGRLVHRAPPPSSH